MDNPKSIAPLMTKLTEIRRAHNVKTGVEPSYVVCNQFTARQLTNEAHTVNKITNDGTLLLIDKLMLVIHPQDHSENLVMEVV